MAETERRGDARVGRRAPSGGVRGDALGSHACGRHVRCSAQVLQAPQAGTHQHIVSVGSPRVRGDRGQDKERAGDTPWVTQGGEPGEEQGGGPRELQENGTVFLEGGRDRLCWPRPSEAQCCLPLGSQSQQAQGQAGGSTTGGLGGPGVLSRVVGVVGQGGPWGMSSDRSSWAGRPSRRMWAWDLQPQGQEK